MASSRSLRSSRSAGSSSTTSLRNDTLNSGSNKRSDKNIVNSPDERRSILNVTTPRRLSTQTSNESASSSASSDTTGQDEGADEEDDDDDDDDNDDDTTDVPAPPTDTKTSSAGLRNTAADHDAMIIDAKSDISNDVTAVLTDESATPLGSPKSEVEDDASDAEYANFDLADDDDDYEGVDNISSASDDSRDFEADVEREIQAAGEDGIDWDDEATYQYDSTMSYDLYGFGYESGMAQSLLDFDLFIPDHQTDRRLTQSAPALDDVEGQRLKTESSTLENMLALDRSVISDSDDSSVAANVTAARVPESKTPSRSSRRVDDDGDTTDEDITWTTVSSPGVTLSRENSGFARRLSKSAKARKNGRKRPLMRRILPDPDKAIAYSVAAPFGSTVRFCTPRTKTYRWMDLRGSRNSSRASSPTMINLEDAYLQGNTRTGAHITDVINGTLFSALHCRNSSAPGSAEASATVSNFYRPLLGDASGPANETKVVDKPVDDSALALIDFSGGVEESSSANDESDSALIVDATMIDDNATMTNTMHSAGNPSASSTNLQIPMTPPPDVDMVTDDAQTSPKKRRLSNRSNDRRTVNQALKRQRRAASNEVLA